MKFYFRFLTSIFCLLLISSCKKEAGPGGTSSIDGKVYARYYNKNFSILADSAYAPDVDVYIMYGNQETFGERQRTTHDGSYKFKYLQKGSYKVYTYSKDSSGAYKHNVKQYSPNVVIVKDVEITKNKQSVEVPDMHIVQ